MQLSTEQVEAVVQWMCEWDELRNSAIPMRFREDFTKWMNLPVKNDEAAFRERIDVALAKAKEIEGAERMKIVIADQDYRFGRKMVHSRPVNHPRQLLDCNGVEIVLRDHGSNKAEPSHVQVVVRDSGNTRQVVEIPI